MPNLSAHLWLVFLRHPLPEMSVLSDNEASPPVTRVQYASRSPSPVSRVQYAVSDDEIVSPQKKKRAYVNPRSAHVRSHAGRHTELPVNLKFTTVAAITDPPGSGSDHVYDTDHELIAETPEVRDNASYLAFLNALDWDDTMFTPLSSSNRLFVVHGWNASKYEATVSNYSGSEAILRLKYLCDEQMARYHLSRTLAGVGTSIMCECPQWRIGSPCVHEQYLTEYGDNAYPIVPGTSKTIRRCIFCAYN